MWRGRDIFRRHKPGFTLIELLVVVAIIALLIAILLPSLGRAREKAKSVACLSNLKSLGLAAYMYQNDNTGFFPSAGHGQADYNDWVYWQCGYPYAHNGSRDINQGMLVPYMGKIFVAKTYLCPSDPNCYPNQPAGDNTYEFSYTASVNIFILLESGNPLVTTNRLRFSQIRAPASKIEIVEQDRSSIDDAAWAPQMYATNGSDIIAVRHEKLTESKSITLPGKGNANFADGHSEPVQRADAMTVHYYDPLVP